MLLTIKERIVSIAPTLRVTDIHERLLFTVKNDLLSIGANLSVFDASGNVLFLVRQKNPTDIFTEDDTVYEVSRNGEPFATIYNHFSLANAGLSVQSPLGNFEINGHPFALDYEIISDGKVFGNIHKKRVAASNNYQLIIPDDTDVPFFIAVMATVDHALQL